MLRKLIILILAPFILPEIQDLPDNVSSSYSVNWCNLDSGFTDVLDSTGKKHKIYVSLTRDGSVWVRLGQDYSSVMDWMLVNQRRLRVQMAMLTDTSIDMLRSLSYTDHCVLTDLDLTVTIIASWNPSFVTVFEPKSKETRIIALKNIRECLVNTTLALTADGQSLRCDGGRLSACGLKNMPIRGQISPAWFLKNINIDLYGPDNWFCPGQEDQSSYTFTGSYYHAYVKVASCQRVTDSRAIGNEIKLRRHKDSTQDVVLIPDPTQNVITAGHVTSWQVFAKIVSIEHSVYLQIWRPATGPAPHEQNTYTLVGQTFFQPPELRHLDIQLPADELIEVEKGDVIGLFFPKHNPIGWSAVPCSSSRQHYRFINSPTLGAQMALGSNFTFRTAQIGFDSCRSYSVMALFANKTNQKSVEDWTCPGSFSPFGSFKRSNVEQSRTPPMSSDAGLDPSVEDALGSPPPHRRPSSITQSNSRRQHVLRTEQRYSAWGGGGDGAGPPIYVILLVLASLLLLMILIGVASYQWSVAS